MDKRKVIAAYRRGFITMKECAQILGMDSVQILWLIGEPELTGSSPVLKKKQPANG